MDELREELLKVGRTLARELIVPHGGESDLLVRIQGWRLLMDSYVMLKRSDLEEWAEPLEVDDA